METTGHGDDDDHGDDGGCSYRSALHDAAADLDRGA